MRIHKLQADIIVELVKKHFGSTAEVWLFGSRVDDSKVGGDIDLYIESDLPTPLIRAKIKMAGELQQYFGDLKIDLVTHARCKPPRGIGEVAKTQGIKLI